MRRSRAIAKKNAFFCALSFLSVPQTLLTMLFLSLSRVGGHPFGLPIPLWFAFSSHAKPPTRLHPLGARRCLAFSLMKRETRGSPWPCPSPTSRQRESVRAGWVGEKKDEPQRGSRRAKARRLLCLRAGLLPRRTPLCLCRANRLSAVSSHTAVTPSSLTSPKHKFITGELPLSFLSVSHTLTMLLSLSCGWAPLRAAHAPLVCLFLSRRATHSASPARCSSLPRI